MAAKDDLKSGIEALLVEMANYDGSNGKTQADANEYYATKLSELIDDHAKNLVAKILASDIAALGLVAGSYPVTSPTPTNSATVEIIDNPV